MTRAHPETNYPCDCHVLDYMDENPDVPITFDDETNEYWLKTGEDCKGSMLFYYCPFCGGRLPDSRRHRLFARLTSEEVMRLRKLTRDIKTIDDAVRILGEPDSDLPDGVMQGTRESETEPSQMTAYRAITYSDLSQTALVRITDVRRDRVEITFSGKFLEERGVPDKPIRTKDSPALKDREEGRETLYCSFCDQSEHEVGRVLRSQSAAICSRCAESFVQSSGS